MLLLLCAKYTKPHVVYCMSVRYVCANQSDSSNAFSKFPIEIRKKPKMNIIVLTERERTQQMEKNTTSSLMLWVYKYMCSFSRCLRYVRRFKNHAA